MPLETKITNSLRTYGAFIDGDEVHTQSTTERRNPGTGEPVARFVSSTEAMTDTAIAAARREFDHGSWPKLSGAERAAVLRRLALLMDRDAERLAAIEAEEVGKPIRMAR